MLKSWAYAPINVKPVGGREGKRWGIGWDFDQSLWPGGIGYLNYLAVPVVGIFEIFLCP